MMIIRLKTGRKARVRLLAKLQRTNSLRAGSRKLRRESGLKLTRWQALRKAWLLLHYKNHKAFTVQESLFSTDTVELYQATRLAGSIRFTPDNVMMATARDKRQRMCLSVGKAIGWITKFNEPVHQLSIL